MEHATARLRRFEAMEPRRMLAADLLQIGAVYVEEDLGNDLHGDTIEITFEGGAENTELTRVVVNGDQDNPGFGKGDVFFDTEPAGRGADSAFPFTIVSFATRDPNASVQATVVDGQSQLILGFDRFYAGDKLVFNIDVDEVEDFSPTETNLEFLNDGFDPITSGVEFQGTLMTAQFTAPHYHDVAGSATFRNRYADQLVGTGLDLPADDEGGRRDRTDGVVIPLKQDPLPIAISGTVYLDHDLNLDQSADEPSLREVELELWRRDGQNYTSTGHTTQTDINGDYSFGFDLGLLPGIYQVRETQPVDLISVGAVPGTVDTANVGSQLVGNRDILTGIEIPLGGQQAIDFDFAEARLASLSGYVYHDRSDDGRRDVGEEGLSNVALHVIPVSTIGPQDIVMLATDTNGFYQAVDLQPGTYRVIEVVQPVDFFDGLDSAGHIDGIVRGQAANPGDRIEDVLLLGGDAGLQYNFGEIAPASLRGRVHLSDGDGDCFSENVVHPPLAGVTVMLLDASGVQLRQTVTDINGEYEFASLMLGSYQIVEVTPDGLLDGGERSGTVNGDPRGSIAGDDHLSAITLGAGEHGVNYDFCEHLPASVAGHVYHDSNNNAVFDTNEDPIEFVLVTLRDRLGDTVAQTRTDSAGAYSFRGLHAGDYVIEESHPAGWLDGLDAAGTVAGNRVGAAENPGDRIRDVQLRYGDAGEDYDFGELLPVKIGGFVYHDRSDDGIRDPGEEEIVGVPVRVIPIATLTPQDEVTVLTDVDGMYMTGLISPGQYRLVEAQQPDGYFDGLDTPGFVRGQARGLAQNPGDQIVNISLVSGDRGVEYNFGEIAPASLRGRVHLSDGDGDCFSENVVHPPLAGVTVMLLDASGVQLRQTVTDINGEYEFASLMLGSYQIVEVTPDGLLDGGERSGTVNGDPRGSIAGDDHLSAITLGAGEHGVNYDFCEHLPASVAGHVYHDSNNNAVFDTNEDPIEFVLVTLRDRLGDTVAQTRTDSAGAYSFRGLHAGDYVIEESHPAGWLDGLDAAGTVAGNRVGAAENPGDRIRDVQLRYGDAGEDYDFGELLPVKIGGFVYHDRSDDGIRDPGEEEIVGVPVRVIPIATLTPQDEVTVLTDVDGMYMTGLISPGQYRLVEAQQPDGYFDGLDTPGFVRGQARGLAQNPGDQIVNISLASGDRGVEYNFGEVAPASIRGRVHLSDKEGDCFSQDVVHPPLSGVTVLLLDVNGGQLRQTTTDSDGRYAFIDLMPGQVVEVTPDGLLDGGERAGNVNGQQRGTITQNDQIGAILLGAGDQAVEYDFCEHMPARISGFVYHDANNNATFDSNEQPIGDVLVTLRDAQAVFVAETRTAADGSYVFVGLRSGDYLIEESHPSGWLDGLDAAGTVDGEQIGVATNPGDQIRNIHLGYGDSGVHYDFGELRPASIEGLVHADPNRNCLVDNGEERLSGVVIQLIDDDGSVLDTTETDASGRYRFDGLLPGSYRVRELQPEDYFHGGERIGSGGGGSQTDLLEFTVQSGDVLVDYNFCELPPSSLSGYVFRDGAPIRTTDDSVPENVHQLRDGVRTSDDAPIQGVVLELRDGLSGEAIMSNQALPGYYGDGAIRVATDANGFYRFAGLLGGRSYAVYEIHPNDFLDGVDTPGTTSGLAINPSDNIPQFVISRLTVNPKNDAIILIPLAVGQDSAENNFSEVLVDRTPRFPPPRVNNPDIELPGASLPPLVPTLNLPPVQIVTPSDIPIFGGGGVRVTWHLSIVNGGTPRGIESADTVNVMLWRQASLLENTSWESVRLNESQWTWVRHDDRNEDDDEDVIIFGVHGGLPVVGDFNGDGSDEVGIYFEGEWFLDLNRNGRWDSEDLWAQLGSKNDLPVVGDWDGDGKDDIGIFGPEWPLDERAISAEPGLPDVLNVRKSRPKNVPPTDEESTEGHRLLRLNERGPRRADVIDHVFRFGESLDIPVAGDFDGDGISSIGVFRDGNWRIDVDGDGRFTTRDRSFVFGQEDDIPLVGDFDRNGVDEIGIYRAGQWRIDSNHNFELDAHDRVFEMGGRDDLPVVGDHDGDGQDEPGLFRPS
jgi:hypothetical protein